MKIENIINTSTIKIFLLVTDGDWKENCYLVNHTPSGEQIVIDPGDDATSIINLVQGNGGKLCHIFLTHAHHDHVGAVAELNRKFRLSCELNKEDVRLLYHAPMYALSFAKRIIEPPLPFLAFDTQPQLYIGDQPITAIHTPGHTPGSVCYSFSDYLFTGDTLLYERIGRTDLPGGNADSLTDSVNNLIESLTVDQFIFPGHGRAWSLSEARQWWLNAKISPPEYKLPSSITS